MADDDSSGRDADRERELVAPLIAHMVEISAGALTLTRDRVDEVAQRSPALGAALAGLLTLDEELRFSEEQRAVAQQDLIALADRLASQNEELLREREAMASLIQDLSAVMLEVFPGILLVPLVGAYDAPRASDLTARTLERVASRQVRHVILDFTGVPRIDDETARHFVSITHGVAMLGAKVVAAGIQPHVATSMIGAGIDLAGMTVVRGLAQALTACLRSASRQR